VQPFHREAFVLFDFHVHTSHSKGVPFTLEEAAKRLKTLGFDGFCVTDELTLLGASQAAAIAATEKIVILVGFEAATDRGHYLVFVPNPQSLPEPRTWLRFDGEDRVVFASLVEAVEARNGVLVAAHPYDRTISGSPGDGLVKLSSVSAMEVLNGRRPNLVNDLAEEAATGLGIVGIGGSDARSSLDELGQAGTMIRGEVRNEMDLIDRIRSYDVWPVWLGKMEISQSQTAASEESPRRERNHNDRPSRDRDRSSRGSSRSDRDRSNGRRPRRSGPRPHESD
jgi:predicted metal-dependent phosphoesterase TrpH